MTTIQYLDSLTVNQIAAGEVVEKPASVVKELVENSLDANASVISVAIQNGGIASIQVIDNGFGMSAEDLKLSFQRHTTSKIRSIDDFSNIKTMGFRGEALASIAAVSRITARSKLYNETAGYELHMEAGSLLRQGAISLQTGTAITVESLFFNTPARYKFLKKDQTEASYITDLMERFILSRPDVTFIFHNNGKEILHSPGNNDLHSAIYTVYGRDIAGALVPVNVELPDFTMTGFVGKPQIGRKNRQHQTLFVNTRMVKSPTVMTAVEEAYKTLLMKGIYPFYVLHIHIRPTFVDINVHPQKTQVKFWDDNQLFKGIYHGIFQSIEPILKMPYDHQISEPIDDAPANTSINPPEQRNAPLNVQMDINPPSDLTIEPVVRVSETESRYDHMKYLGSLFNTYLIFEIKDSMLLIDQHAAHERIIFERLVQKHLQGNNSIVAQPLLEALIVELTPAEMMQLLEKENEDLLSSIGFDYEIFGKQSVSLRSIPLSRDMLDPVKAFKTAIDSLTSLGKKPQEIIYQCLYSIACKAAVKAHDKLDIQEILSLINDIENTSKSSYCPHGRPSMIKLSKNEIEKWFKRIVH